MKRSKKRLTKIISFFMAVIMLVTTVSLLFLASATEVEEVKPTVDVSPINVEVTTEKPRYTLLSVIKFNVRVTNNSDTDIENINIAAKLGEDLVFVKGSETTTLKDRLAPGESYEWSYKAKVSRDRLKSADKLLVPLAFMRDIFVGDYLINDSNANSGSQMCERYIRANLISAYSNSYSSDSTVQIWYDKKQSPIDENQAKALELEKIKDLNNGILPDITMEDIYDIPSFIHGKYTGNIISSGQDAINSLKDVQHLFKIKNPQEEFKCIKEYSVLDTKYYRLQQYYNDIKVEGAQIVVATDNSGHSESINSSYVPLDFELKLINITEQKAKEIVINEFDKEGSTNGNVELIICKDKNSNEYLQAYKIIGSGYKQEDYVSGTYIVSAITGEILGFNSFGQYMSVESSGIDNNNQQRKFDVEKIDNDMYYLADFSKNISVYNAGNKQVTCKTVENNDGTYSVEIYWNNVWYAPDSWFTQAEVVKSNNNQWDDKEAVSLYANLLDTYNYYLSILGRKGYNDKNGEVFAVYNDNNKFDWSNAYSYNTKVLNTTVLSFGKNNTLSLDGIAHEYTHSVQGSIVSLPYQGESGAVMEAYADIMGEIIQGDSNWKNDFRNIANPSANKTPSFYKGAYWVDTSDVSKKNDHGGVHNNSTVLSHAAYLMNKNGIDMTELAKIFYKSMSYYADADYYYEVNINFSDFREAVVEASRQVNENNTDIVKAAFDKVGVKETSVVTGNVKIGDRIAMGKYNGEVIFWRCVDIDENGPLMLSEKVLCNKEFDAAGDNEQYHSDGWGYIRKNRGSNCWSDSNIRQWLNTSGTVTYSHCPPSYANENGFMTSFTDSELARIKTVTQKTYVNSWEQQRNGYVDGGSRESSDTTDIPSLNMDYSDFWYQLCTDRFFLLNQEQIYRVFKNNPEYLYSDNKYYTRAACNRGASYENVFVIGESSVFYSAFACDSSIGIRPAFYLNEN